jgi:hypothetical protein
MTRAEINAVLERATSWPQEAQEQLVHSAITIEKQYVGVYALSDDERSDVREALTEVARGEFASDHSVRKVFADLQSR